MSVYVYLLSEGRSGSSSAEAMREAEDFHCKHLKPPAAAPPPPLPRCAWSCPGGWGGSSAAPFSSPSTSSGGGVGGSSTSDSTNGSIPYTWQGWVDPDWRSLSSSSPNPPLRLQNPMPMNSRVAMRNLGASRASPSAS
eukprot:CAMPEP_0194568938 /NCGR_PEP_ID=MMETSP0292-20121207/6859_1 /TAXON_ID=39354 /ORGANISM="Heterosigma akashiwo, Strain CCMP2393" /LENGTH=137 /DNA_ID=CAMNT_0039419099 /DNA_START=210 /DNA_END=619 /DNA_ORIENTATION=+